MKYFRNIGTNLVAHLEMIWSLETKKALDIIDCTVTAFDAY
jgi:hypothetical protein